MSSRKPALTILRIPPYSRGMDTLPLKHTKWPERLALDTALMLEGSGETLDEVKDRHHVTAEELLVFNKDPVFLKKVKTYREEVRDKGMTFKLKARSQAEELLITSWSLIHSPDVSAAVKADLIKSTVKWGGLEPKNEINMDGSGSGVKITINLGGQNHEATVIDHEATDAVDEDNNLFDGDNVKDLSDRGTG